MLLLAALTAAMLVGSTSAWASSAPAADRADVTFDDARDVVQGSGGLILPAGVDASTRQEVASCPGCRWRTTSPCLDSPADLGVAFDGQVACSSVTRGCPEGALRRTWFSPMSGAWRDLGLLCLAERPVTVEDIGARVSARVEESLPALAPTHLPSKGVVTGLPTVFASGQPSGARRFTWTILGQSVTVTARPAWTWRFPDGTVLETDDAGSLRRQGAIRHTFVHSGPALVRCEVAWRGEFAVAGLGTFAVPGEARQQGSIVVIVGEGRALLRPRA